MDDLAAWVRPYIRGAAGKIPANAEVQNLANGDLMIGWPVPTEGRPNRRAAIRVEVEQDVRDAINSADPNYLALIGRGFMRLLDQRLSADFDQFNPGAQPFSVIADDVVLDR